MRLTDFISMRACTASLILIGQLDLFPLHATELEAVSIRLVMGGEVVVVENPDTEHSRVNAGTQEEDGDEARHLVEKRLRHNFRATGGDYQ